MPPWTAPLAALMATGCVVLPVARPHPLVAQMSGWDERSIESVARFVAAHEPDPAQRMKALHDWVAANVRYDVAALAQPQVPFEDANAEWVFAERRAVCAGYARLLAALGQAAGLNILAVDGKLRADEPTDVDRERGHAWNVVELDGEWYGIDATWDAGVVARGKFHRRYSTEYLFVAPEQLHELSPQSMLALSLARLPSRLDGVWRGPGSRAERLATVRAIRAEAAPPEDAELGWAGDRARAAIDKWLDLHEHEVTAESDPQRRRAN
jgi:hypothetical protein